MIAQKVLKSISLFLFLLILTKLLLLNEFYVNTLVDITFTFRAIYALWHNCAGGHFAPLSMKL